MGPRITWVTPRCLGTVLSFLDTTEHPGGLVLRVGRAFGGVLILLWSCYSWSVVIPPGPIFNIDISGFASWFEMGRTTGWGRHAGSVVLLAFNGSVRNLVRISTGHLRDTGGTGAFSCFEVKGGTGCDIRGFDQYILVSVICVS